MQKAERIQSKYPQGIKSRQHKKNPKKNVFSFIDIRLLVNAKQALSSLPESSEYELEHEVDYARTMSQVLPIVATIRIQQIEYIVTQTTMRKIMVQLARQVQFKQLVIVLLKQIMKGLSCFEEILLGQLFDMLSFLVQMQGLSLHLTGLSPEKQSKILKKCVLSSATHELVTNIVKWYSCSASGRAVAAKYKELQLAMER